MILKIVQKKMLMNNKNNNLYDLCTYMHYVENNFITLSCRNFYAPTMVHTTLYYIRII